MGHTHTRKAHAEETRAHGDAGKDHDALRAAALFAFFLSRAKSDGSFDDSKKLHMKHEHEHAGRSIAY